MKTKLLFKLLRNIEPHIYFNLINILCQISIEKHTENMFFLSHFQCCYYLRHQFHYAFYFYCTTHCPAPMPIHLSKVSTILRHLFIKYVQNSSSTLIFSYKIQKLNFLIFRQYHYQQKQDYRT